MRGKHIKIELDAITRETLENFISTGTRSVHLVNRAKIILELDEAHMRKPLTQDEIAEKVGISRQTVKNAKADFLKADDVSLFLQRKKRETPPVPPKITGEVEAHIIALACSPVPEGYSKWTLLLLANKCVELKYIDSISCSSVSRILKKQNLNHI